MKTINLDNKQPKDLKSKYEMFEDYIFENYTLQINEINNQEIIIRKKDNETINIYDLIRDCKIANIKTSKQMIADLFKTSKIEKYSPYRAFFKNLPEHDPTKKSEIEKLNSYLIARQFDDGKDKNERNLYLLKKWLVNAVAQIFDETSNDVMLLFVSSNKQGIGKTRLVRNLIQIGFIKTGQSILKNLENLPEAITRYPFVFYDEMKGLKRLPALENFKTSITDVFVEYTKFQKIYIKKRIASFIGTADSSELLFDETGSRRFAIIELQNIDYEKYEKAIDFNKIWAEAFYLYEQNKDMFKFSKKDFYEFQDFNTKYYKSTSIQYYIERYFAPVDETHPDATKMTATQILSYLIQKNLPTNVYKETSPVKIGFALKKLNFKHRYIKDENKNTAKYYFIKILN